MPLIVTLILLVSFLFGPTVSVSFFLFSLLGFFLRFAGTSALLLLVCAYVYVKMSTNGLGFT